MTLPSVSPWLVSQLTCHPPIPLIDAALIPMSAPLIRAWDRWWLEDASALSIGNSASSFSFTSGTPAGFLSEEMSCSWAHSGRLHGGRRQGHRPPRFCMRAQDFFDLFPLTAPDFLQRHNSASQNSFGASKNFPRNLCRASSNNMLCSAPSSATKTGTIHGNWYGKVFQQRQGFWFHHTGERRSGRFRSRIRASR